MRKSFAAIAASVATLVGAAFAPRPEDPVSVLVVGDSVIEQTAAALVDYAPSGMTVTVAGGAGSAPCDWEAGYTDPWSGRHQSYQPHLRSHPDVVVVMFTGNPGFSGPAHGCVDADRPYSEADLIASYRSALMAMAEQASAAGATVYFERPPTRNPQMPPGVDQEEHTERGFQGTAEVGLLMQSIADTAPAGDRWIYEQSGAAAVTGPGFSYTTTLPCRVPLPCTGTAPVRAGDAVHLDTRGCGAILFAVGIESALPGASARPKRQRAYPGCTQLERTPGTVPVK